MSDVVRLPSSDLSAGERTLDAEQSRYLGRVLRLGPGDRLVVFDPAAALEADAEVVAAGRSVVLRLGAPRAASRTAEGVVEVVQSLAKGQKVDAVVRAATELGATRLWIARAERSDKRGGNLARWRRIAVQAARQCGRGDVPDIEGGLDLRAALAACSAPVRLCLHPEAEATLAGHVQGDAVALAIGPEGGFAPVERAEAERQGFVTVRLGRFVMRTETACAAALGALAALREAQSSSS